MLNNISHLLARENDLQHFCIMFIIYIYIYTNVILYDKHISFLHIELLTNNIEQYMKAYLSSS